MSDNSTFNASLHHKFLDNIKPSETSSAQEFLTRSETFVNPVSVSVKFAERLDREAKNIKIRENELNYASV